ncbi:MAG: S46 family peptidase [Hyphomonadaceae bacterium]|nr:S46 family peptidase [Hyphomonadaceae bacterium]
MRTFFLTVLAACAASMVLAARARAEEGMWTFDNFPTARMRAEMDWAPDQVWLDRAMQATVRLPTCSGVNVSAEGLVLTNQHCVVACLNQLSTPENNYFVSGFAARARAQEARCPGLSVQVLESIADVTERVETAAAGAGERPFAQVRDGEIARIEAECSSGALRCEVATLYEGARYALYRYRRYDDVRMVFAPEYAMAQFGGDAQNFQFPRTCIDFAVLRLYQNGRPVATPAHLDVRITPPLAEEIVLVSGNPGFTSRLKTLAEIEFDRDVYAPWREAALNDARARISAYAGRGSDHARIAADTLETVANDAEAYEGRRAALSDAAGVARVRARQEDLQARVARNQAAQREVGDAWGEIARAQARYRPFFFAHQYAEARAGERSLLFAWAREIVRGAAERAKPEDERLQRYAPPQLARIDAFVRGARPVRADWEELNLAIWLNQLDRYVRPENAALASKILGEEAPDALAARLAGSRLADPVYRAQLWAGGAAAVAASDDPLIVFVRNWDGDARALAARYRDDVEAPMARAHERIGRVRFRAFEETMYPEASFSPRISYGRVLGWSEGGGEIGPFTRLSDLLRASNAQVTPVWRRAQLDPDIVVNFTTSTDIISGNSGSGLLDRDGRVVGVVFDGNIHALGGEYYYDPARNRTVSVSSQMIAAALTVYGMGGLLEELRH